MNFLNKRKKIAEVYDKHFHNNEEIFLPQMGSRNYSSNHLYILNYDFNKSRFSRNHLMKELNKRNIVTQVHYIPIPLQLFYKKMGYNMHNLEKAQEYYNKCISLPIYYDLDSGQQKFIINSLNEIMHF